MGQRLLKGLESLKEFTQVGEVRGIGLLCGVEFVKDRQTREPDYDTANKVANMTQARGVRARAVTNATLAFSPPLIISEEEVDQVVKTVGAVLDSIA